MDPFRCVVIELELSGEDRFITYLLARKNDYNWIIRESMEDPSKAKACVWWCKGKEFFNTPLRSFLKRLRNNHMPGLTISNKMTSEEGVQLVCKGIPGTIIKYHLREMATTEEGVRMVCAGIPGNIIKYHLDLTLRRLLQGETPLPTGVSNETPPTIGVSKGDDGSCGNPILDDILQKLNDLTVKFTDLRENMARDLYSQYDPPWSYPDTEMAQAHEEAREARREAEEGEGH